MANIVKKINTNEILPNIEYTSVVLDNAVDDAGVPVTNRYTLDLRLRITPRASSLDDVILDKEYLKYIRIYFLVTKNEQQQNIVEKYSTNNTVNEFVRQISFSSIRNGSDLFDQIDSFQLPISNFSQVDQQFEYFIDKKLFTSEITDTSNSLTLNTFVYFDVNSYFADNKLNNTYAQVFNTSFGAQEVYVYPVTDNDSVYEVLVLDTTKQPVDSIVADLRSVDYFINKTITAPTINNDLKKSYLSFYVGNDFRTSLKNYMIFEYGKFLIDKSCIDDNIFNNFSVSIDVYRKSSNESDNALIDRITFFKDGTTKTARVSSFYEVSRMAFLDRNSVLIYFEDNILESTSAAKFYYEVEVKYVDKSFYEIYEPYNKTGDYFEVSNQYDQIKNFIYLANKNAYSKTITAYEFAKDQKPIPTIFYLDTDTNKFTKQFIEYFNKQTYIDTSTGIEKQQKLDISKFVTNFVNLINKFLTDDSYETTKITETETNNIIRSLDLSKATLKTYLKFFKAVDTMMNNLALIFSSAKQNRTKYIKKSENQAVEKEDTYFRLNDFVDSREVPTLKRDKIIELFSASKKQYVLPKYYVDVDNNKIDNLLVEDLDKGKNKVDTSLMSRAMRKAASKKKKQLKKTDELTLDAELLLLDLGVSFKEYKQTTITKRSDRVNKNFAVKQTIDSYKNKDLTLKITKNKLNRVVAKQVQQNDVKRMITIQSVNDVVNDILFTTRVPDIKYDNKFISPSIKLKYFDFNDKVWKQLTDDGLKKIRRDIRLFIEASITKEGYSNIFDLNDVDTDLETRYFILEP